MKTTNTEFNKFEDQQARDKAFQMQAPNVATAVQGARRPEMRGATAVWQARLVLFVMINIAQMWILSATVEAALAGEYKQLLPLVISSGVCWLIGLTIFLWWKPASKRPTSTGFIENKKL